MQMPWSETPAPANDMPSEERIRSDREVMASKLRTRQAARWSQQERLRQWQADQFVPSVCRMEQRQSLGNQITGLTALLSRTSEYLHPWQSAPRSTVRLTELPAAP